MVASATPSYPHPVYTFTVNAGEDFSAHLVLSATHSLYELADLCIKAVGFDFDHAFGFYDNLKNPYRSTEEFTLFADIGEEAKPNDLGVERTFIGDVFEPGRTLLLLFDYGDDWHFPVYCESVLPGKNRRKVKKIISRTGTPPIQYPDLEDDFV
jgi:hypothetical protein